MRNLSRESLVAHRQRQNGVKKGGSGQEGDEEGRGNNPRTFRMAFTAKARPKTYPVERCSGQESMRTAMQVHFWNRQVRGTVVILE